MSDFTRVQVNASTQKLQVAASSDETRYNITGVYFDDNVNVATDGHIMAVEKKEKVDEPVPSKTILKFNKPKQLDKNRGSETFFRLETKYVSEQGSVAERTTGAFPDYSNVIPSEFKTPVRIAFNLALLTRLAAALEHNNRSLVTLEFDGSSPLGPILVDVSNQDGSGRPNKFGVLMPCRTDDVGETLLQRAKRFVFGVK